MQTRFLVEYGLKPIFHCDTKPLALGPGIGLDPQRHTFASPNAKYPNMLIYFGQNLAKICVTPTPNLKFALPPTPTPDASQWNIGGVGPSGIGAGVGHVYFRLFVSRSFAFGSQRKRSFQWNMGSRVRHGIWNYLLNVPWVRILSNDCLKACTLKSV